MREKRGITLVALVVTIVVLLILAGVTINFILSDTGIIKKAEEAKTKQEEAEQNVLDAIKKIEEEANKILDGKTEGEEIDYNQLTPEERFERMEQMTVQPKVLRYGDEGIEDVSNKQYFKNNIGIANVGETLNCECNQVYNIYKKAKEMGLVEVYSTYDSNNRNIITAPIKEPSLVVSYFLCRNINQVATDVYPVAMSLEYEVRINNIKKADNDNWMSFEFPSYGNQYGDNETCIMWVGQEFVDLGYVIEEARVIKFPNFTMERLKQTADHGWHILTQTNFLKAAQELGLDLSNYHCDHITK